MLFRSLAHLSHVVDVAADGAEAVAHVAAKRFDVVLMDRHMEEMDGLAAARKIRRLERATGAHVPIIAMTAATMPDDRQQCIEAGMDGYLAKPVSLDALREAIRSARQTSGGV